MRPVPGEQLEGAAFAAGDHEADEEGSPGGSPSTVVTTPSQNSACEMPEVRSQQEGAPGRQRPTGTHCHSRPWP